jgi:hypothetical protein
MANLLQVFLTSRLGSGRRLCELRHSTTLRLPAYGGISGPGARIHVILSPSIFDLCYIIVRQSHHYVPDRSSVLL